MIRNFKFLLVAAISAFSIGVSAEPAGSLISTQGTVFAVKTDGKRKILAPASFVEKGDVIHTERDSHAKIRFTDGSEMLIRPNSSMRIQEYNFDDKHPEKDSFVLGLLRGGLRQLTGFIGKRGNQDAYRLHGSSATIGIRGTDFTARVCQAEECPVVARPTKTPPSVGVSIAARVVALKGRVIARQANGVQRDLAQHAAIYRDDLIETDAGGYASLVFVDETRVVVPSGSSLRIANYQYVPNEPTKSQVFLSVVKGAFRMVTGLIGRSAPENIRIGASTATIGIRGTSFDLICLPGDVAQPENYQGNGSLCGEGLLASIREGIISVTTENGNHAELAGGQAGYVAGTNSPTRLLERSPNVLDAAGMPLPESIPLDMPGMFGINGNEVSGAGLYVTVSDGRVVIAQANQEMQLEAGESGFASRASSALQRLYTPPSFMSQDLRESEKAFGFRGCRM